MANPSHSSRTDRSSGSWTSTTRSPRRWRAACRRAPGSRRPGDTSIVWHSRTSGPRPVAPDESTQAPLERATGRTPGDTETAAQQTQASSCRAVGSGGACAKRASGWRWTAVAAPRQAAWSASLVSAPNRSTWWAPSPGPLGRRRRRCAGVGRLAARLRPQGLLAEEGRDRRNPVLGRVCAVPTDAAEGRRPLPPV